MRYPPIPKTALVTGCSSGIGLAAATMLQARGWRVLATARKARDLEMLIANGFEAIEIDMSDSESVRDAGEAALTLTDGQLGAVVNNAGFGQPGAFEDLTREALREQFEVNVFGLQQLTRQFIPSMCERGSGRIVMVSSVVGNVALPFLGAYSASKFALEALSDSLRVEMVGTGVAVSIMQPGPIITAFRHHTMDKIESDDTLQTSRFRGFYKREMERKRTRVKTPGFINKPPEAVGIKIVHALESARPWRRYCISPSAYAGAWIRRLFPFAVVDALLTKRVLRTLELNADLRSEG
jgi:short-subunit dehydrogenase